MWLKWFLLHYFGLCNTTFTCSLAHRDWSPERHRKSSGGALLSVESPMEEYVCEVWRYVSMIGTVNSEVRELDFAAHLEEFWISCTLIFWDQHQQQVIGSPVMQVVRLVKQLLLRITTAVLPLLGGWIAFLQWLWRSCVWLRRWLWLRRREVVYRCLILGPPGLYVMFPWASFSLWSS